MSRLFSKMRGLKKGQKGITGLETAIILIAFVVVASVFAYTVLSAGIFSSEKGKEAVNAGLQQARGTMELQGGVIAKDTGSDDDVDQVIFTVSNALDGEPIDLATTTDTDSDGDLSDEAAKSHVTVISLITADQRIDDAAWTATVIGKGDSDELLEPGEKMQITVDVTKLTTDLAAYDAFTIEVKPDKGSTITIERTLPAVIDDVMYLD